MRTEPTSAIATADPDGDSIDPACLEDVAKPRACANTESLKGRRKEHTNHGESTE
jgi:hypothetical protein